MPHEPQAVIVLETRNPATLAVAKSILDGAEIFYIVKGENLQNLGMGQVGLRFSPAVGPVQILVRSEDVSTARELLGEFDE
jgi:hypothetical protein